MATTYTIKAGDTLAKIAAQLGTTVQALASANGISDPNKISAGKTLTVPTSTASPFSISNGAIAPNGPPVIPTTSKTTPTAPVTPPKTQTTNAQIPPTATSGNIVQFDPNTGKPLSPGQSVTYNGQTYTQGQPMPTSGSTTPQGGSSNSGSSIPYSTTDANGNVTFNTGDPALDTALGSLSSFVTTTLAKGNVVNPALQITPDLASQFLQEAHSQIDPEGQQNLTDAIDGINASLSNLQNQYENSTAEQQAQFEQSVASERNTSGDNGTAFSGERGLAENYMLGSENRSLASLGSTYATNVGNTLRTGAAAVGTNSLGLNGTVSDFNLPNDLTTYTSTLEGARGGVGGPGAALNLNYNPNNYAVGSIPQAYGTALTSSANQFLSSYLQSAGNNSRTFQDLNGTPSLA